MIISDSAASTRLASKDPPVSPTTVTICPTLDARQRDVAPEYWKQHASSSTSRSTRRSAWRPSLPPQGHPGRRCTACSPPRITSSATPPLPVARTGRPHSGVDRGGRRDRGGDEYRDRAGCPQGGVGPTDGAGHHVVGPRAGAGGRRASHRSTTNTDQSDLR